MIQEKEPMFIEDFELEIDTNVYPECKKRRNFLVDQIKERFPDKKGIIVLFGNFDSSETTKKFSQDATFFYLLGIEEATSMAIINIETKKTTVYIPYYHHSKREWDTSLIELNAKPEQFHIDSIKPLGTQHSGIVFSPTDDKKYFSHFFDEIKKVNENGDTIFTTVPDKYMSFATQLFFDLTKKYCNFTETVSINDIITIMRMKKSEQEIARLYQAIDTTITAHEAAAMSIQDGIAESEVQAAAEFVFTAHGCSPAFPTIIASGKNATILHYNRNNKNIKKQELVLIDMGARSNQYCADLSRTYPASGKFTARQKALYEIVLEVQAHIAEIAKPGYFLNNKTKPELSLQHIALSLFAKHRLEKYFIHGIGHHLGLNVHDLSHSIQPLEEGNVITIEPGLYIPEENIGIRIEDNYWITKGGAVCLSENLPKTVTDIEKIMKYKNYE